ncbi:MULTISPECIES: hypothetical protein [Oceanobacillus]|uniref:Cytochrome c oxidase subunit 4 n=2 Tax=Oceanobacillus TaxID=182709 RepID=A0A0A1MPS7_9BACI|nr:hypothetical protein [Oceanobacillus oncorhynchi]MDM8102509.1 hypothetical protein [Oceanobacillus oncorhynchi]CEI81744.1 hypothetical protein BN997_01589 [Oceanobacillus oncorhynchi]
MIGLLNIGSLLLGLVAWILPVIILTRYDKNNPKNWAAFSLASMSACAISLCFQLAYNYHLVKIEDWIALMDTAGAVVSAAAVLLIVTILLNAITIFVYRDKAAK